MFRTEYLASGDVRETETERAVAVAVSENIGTSRYVVHVDADGRAGGAWMDYVGGADGPEYAPHTDRETGVPAGRFEVVIFRDGSGRARVSSDRVSRLVYASEPETAVRRFFAGRTERTGPASL